MAKLIKQDLSIKNKIASFNIKVRDSITVIGGDSSSGKTLFYKEKQLYSMRYKDNSTIFINYLNKQDFKRIFEENVENKIIFVDNADIVVPRDIEIFRKIFYSSNQFVFFGRDVTRYDKNYDNWAELKEISLGKFKLEYVFKKVGVIWQ